MKNYPHHSSIGNLDANLVAFFAYLIPMVMSFLNIGASIAWVIPLIILVMEKESRFVERHAAHALTFFIISGVIHLLFSLVLGSLVFTSWMSNIRFLGFFYNGGVSILTLLLGLVGAIISFILFICKIYCLIKAYNYDDVSLVLLTSIANFLLNLKR